MSGLYGCISHNYTGQVECPRCMNQMSGQPQQGYGTYQSAHHSQAINAPPVGGLKHDTSKPDFSFISYELMEQVALVRAFGAKKYSRSNWKKGFKVTRSCAAALRHIFQFLSGETNDSESGHMHLAHAVCCLEHAIYDMLKHPENDDRDKA